MTRFAATRQPELRDALVVNHLGLAHWAAARFAGRGESVDDLVQVAVVGLVKAVDRFDPDRGTAFSSYAVPTILGELKRYFRDSGWAVHVPRGMQERVLEVNGAVSRLGRQLGRSPTPVEIADALSMSTEDVLEALEAAVAYDAVSLEAPRSSDEQDGAHYGETLGGEDERFELIELGATIAPTLKALPERDRLVLHLRFVEDLTQSEIAARIGVSQMHVSRLIRRALTRLRTVAEAHEGGPGRRAQLRSTGSTPS